MDIKELKKENREIRKKFSRENKSFVIEVTYYIDQFSLSKFEYYEILNLILNDLNTKVDKNTNLWEVIDNPTDYCDKFLIGKEKKIYTLKSEILNIVMLLIFLVSLYTIVFNTSPNYYLKTTDSDMFLLTSGSVIKSLTLILFTLIPRIDRRNNPFNQNRYKVRFISIETIALFIGLFLGGLSETMITINVNKYIVISVFFISLAFDLIKRRMT